MGWPRWATGPLSIIVVSALVFGGSAFLSLLNSRGKIHPEYRAEDSPRRQMCPIKEYRHKEKRYVSVYTKESDSLRWKLPAIVTFRRIQDEFCTTKEYRYLETVFWQDGGHTDFKDCALFENLIGDCVDEQGRPWRAKVFAKTTDEVPTEYDYPQGSIPNVRAQLRE
jgi:hypothetical protein